ncbi:hypothetical protein PR048_022330 [Dryococelus australis]|uniref:Uncharacterized protein n=1 Tax=Dryococelus australis TaxID=614101 RepID=A0ABQ9H0S5_9NEOP|nr:hypothetical protein PR048_022330 [Dryococelus australis]
MKFCHFSCLPFLPKSCSSSVGREPYRGVADPQWVANPLVGPKCHANDVARQLPLERPGSDCKEMRAALKETPGSDCKEMRAGLKGTPGSDCKEMRDPKSFIDQYDRSGGRYEATRGDMREELVNAGSGPRSNMGGNPRGRWGPAERRTDEYPSKRRRYLGHSYYHATLVYTWRCIVYHYFTEFFQVRKYKDSKIILPEDKIVYGIAPCFHHQIVKLCSICKYFVLRLTES